MFFSQFGGAKSTGSHQQSSINNNNHKSFGSARHDRDILKRQVHIGTQLLDAMRVLCDAAAMSVLLVVVMVVVLPSHVTCFTPTTTTTTMMKNLHWTIPRRASIHEEHQHHGRCGFIQTTTTTTVTAQSNDGQFDSDDDSTADGSDANDTHNTNRPAVCNRRDVLLRGASSVLVGSLFMSTLAANAATSSETTPRNAIDSDKDDDCGLENVLFGEGRWTSV